MTLYLISHLDIMMYVCAPPPSPPPHFGKRIHERTVAVTPPPPTHTHTTPAHTNTHTHTTYVIYGQCM